MYRNAVTETACSVHRKNSDSLHDFTKRGGFVSCATYVSCKFSKQHWGPGGTLLLWNWNQRSTDMAFLGPMPTYWCTDSRYFQNF